MQKIADSTTCQQFSAGLGLQGSLFCHGVRVAFLVLGLFSVVWDIFMGVGFGFWWVVWCMMPIGPGLLFLFFCFVFPLVRMVSGVAPFASRIFGTYIWRPQGGARWSFSTSRWCLPHF